MSAPTSRCRARRGTLRASERVGVAFAVARLRVRAAAAAYALEAGLDRPCLLPGRIVEVGLDSGRRAAETLRDLRYRQAFRVAIVVGEGNRAPSFNDPVARARRGLRRHARRRYRRRVVFSPRRRARFSRRLKARARLWATSAMRGYVPVA